MRRKRFSYFSYQIPTSIDDVIEEMALLDKELQGTELDNLRAFNTTYLIITKAVFRKSIEGYFQNPEHMEHVDVIFADYYFSALRSFVSGNVCPKAWQILFTACGEKQCYQYIYMALGVNAHVTNDLSQSLLKAGTNYSFKSDYDKVNEILSDSLDDVIYSLNEKSSVLNSLENNLKQAYAFILQKLIVNWREKAWFNYLQLRSGQCDIECIEHQAQYIAEELVTMENIVDFFKLPKLTQ